MKRADPPIYREPGRSILIFVCVSLLVAVFYPALVGGATDVVLYVAGLAAVVYLTTIIWERIELRRTLKNFRKQLEGDL